MGDEGLKWVGGVGKKDSRDWDPDLWAGSSAGRSGNFSEPDFSPHVMADPNCVRVARNPPEGVATRLISRSQPSVFSLPIAPDAPFDYLATSCAASFSFSAQNDSSRSLSGMRCWLIRTLNGRV